MKPKKHIEQGDKEWAKMRGTKVRDKVTGLQGIAVARCMYLHGCDHIAIQPMADNKRGRVPRMVWFDVMQVESVGDKKRRTCVPKNFGYGGPGDHPPGTSHPEHDDGVWGGS